MEEPEGGKSGGNKSWSGTVQSTITRTFYAAKYSKTMAKYTKGSLFKVDSILRQWHKKAKGWLFKMGSIVRQCKIN